MLNKNFLLALLIVAAIFLLIGLSDNSPTGAVTLTATQRGLGSFISDIPLYFGNGYSKVTKVDAKATIGGRVCFAGPTKAKIYGIDGKLIDTITLPNAGAQQTVTKSKTFNQAINVKKIVVEDAGDFGTCQYIDYAEATLTYTDDPPTIDYFKANPEKGVGNTEVDFGAGITDDKSGALNVKFYANSFQNEPTKTVDVQVVGGQSADVSLGEYTYTAPADGSIDYKAKLEISDGKNSPVTSEKIIKIYASDKTSPVVDISSDKENYYTGGFDGGIVTLTAIATDNIGISSVEIYVDNILVQTCLSSPCLYQTSYSSQGTHYFYAVAKDSAPSPNTGTSDTKSFKVSQKYVLNITKIGDGFGSISGITSSKDGSIIFNCATGSSGCAFDYADGTSIALTATSDYGSQFNGWGGDCASAGKSTKCSIFMDSQKIVIANFSAIPCTWSKQESGTTEILFSVHFVDPNIGWAVGDRNTILKTTDGGNTWLKQDSGFSSNVFPSVHFINSNIGWVSGWVANQPNSGIILKTTDGGKTWINHFLGPPPISSIYFIDSNTGWAAGGINVFKTTNGGSTWVEKNTPNPNNLNTIYFVNSNVGWAASFAGGVVKTTDGGENWVKIYNGDDSARSIFFLDSNKGWFVGYISILKTIDSGNTWIRQEMSGKTADLLDVYFVNSNTGWVAGRGAILKTTDGGNNWQKENIPFTNQLFFKLFFINSNTGWAVGSGGTILKCSIPEQGRGKSQQQSSTCVDKDGDGFGKKGTDLSQCPQKALGDCDDSKPFVNPWSREKCNGIDDDCNGQKDEGFSSHYGNEQFNQTKYYKDLANAVEPEKTSGVCGAGNPNIVSCTGGKWRWDYTPKPYYESQEGITNTDNCWDYVENDCDGKLDCNGGELGNGYCTQSICDALKARADQQPQGHDQGCQGQGCGGAGSGQFG